MTSVDESDSHGQPGHRTWLCNDCYIEGLRADEEARAAEQALVAVVRAADEERAAREFYAQHYDRFEQWQVVQLTLKVYVPTTGSEEEAEQLVREILDEAQFDIRVARMAP